MLSRLDYSGERVAGERILLLMLPPAGGTAAGFAEAGLVAAVHAADGAIDIVALQPDLGLYLDGEITAALHRQIIEPALRQGYRRIWLLGISMGGMGALLYAAAHAGTVERVILLAPFIGTRGTLAALAKAGGLAGGGAPSGATDPEQKLLGWLHDYAASGRQCPEILLGYGAQDRFAPGHRMLADILPPQQVVTLPGGHDWACWLAVLQNLLALHPAGWIPVA